MESFLSRYKNPLVLLAVLLVQIIGLAVQVRRPSSDTGNEPGVRLIQYWALMAVTPPERLVHFVGHEMSSTWGNYVDLVGVRKKNRELQMEIDRLRLEQANLAVNAQQAEQLQALFHFKQKYIDKTVAAQVIGASGSDQSHLLILDKGSADGLKRYDPVITPKGVVGRLSNVFPHKSLLLEISDAMSGAGVVLAKSHLQGVLRGDKYGQPVIVDMLPDARIKPGVKVMTSGGDQVFPPGLLVGTVKRVTPDRENPPLVNVLVDPAVHLDAVEHVLVITKMGNQMPAQEKKDIIDSQLAQEQERTADILAEQLPSKIDPEAPPEELLTSMVKGFRLITPLPPLHPPQPAHPDQFTPGATPPASEMRPGALNGPVLQGTENMPPKKAKSKGAAPSGTATAGQPTKAGPKKTAKKSSAVTPQGGK